MTQLLLDTSAYSAYLRGHAALQRSIQEADLLILNSIVIGELLAGFAKGGNRRKNEDDLQSFLGSDRVRVISVDEETSERYAVILNSLWAAGTPIPTNDIWIAASAMQHGLRLLTTDAHYQKVPQILLDLYPIN